MQFPCFKQFLLLSIFPVSMLAWSATAAQSAGMDSAPNPNAIVASRPTAPLRTADFINSLGMCVHVGSRSGPSSDIANIADKMAYLGLYRIRADLKEGTMPSIEKMMQVYNIRFEPIITYDPLNPQLVQTLQHYLERNARWIDVIEGPNEVDIQKTMYGGDYSISIPNAQKKQQALYALVKSDPALSTMQVANFSLGPGTTYADYFQDMTPYVDYSNIHAYSHENPPGDRIVKQIAYINAAHGKPVILSETGQTTVAFNPSYASRTKIGVGEHAQAKDILNEAMDTSSIGVAYTYLYELFDEVNDPDNTDMEDHFGLFHFDGSTKPAALGLHNLIAILHDDGKMAARFSPAPLDYSLAQSNASASMDVGRFHHLLQKSNGDYYIILWAEPGLWSVGKHAPLPAATPNHVHITFPKKHAQVSIYDPLAGSDPIEQYHATGEVDVSVQDHPILVQISK